MARRGGWAGGFNGIGIDCECFLYDTVLSNLTLSIAFLLKLDRRHSEKITAADTGAAQSLH